MPLIFSNLPLPKEIFWDLGTANYNKGRCYYQNTKKIWKNSQLGLNPPLKTNSDIFEFENILTAEAPLKRTSQKGYLGTFILKMGKLRVFIFLF